VETAGPHHLLTYFQLVAFGRWCIQMNEYNRLIMHSIAVSYISRKQHTAHIHCAKN